MTTLSRSSPAKLNLTLRVGERRDDGYHEIESLVARLDFSDVVTVTERADRRLLVECDDPRIPCDHTNLALRAAELLAKFAGVRRGIRISLTKRIPPGAGLGGGSSNAMTTLKLLNTLWKLGFSHPELADLGSRLGSDVPLFAYGPVCVIRGRGEQVEEWKQPWSAWAAVVLPDLQCATSAVYAERDKLETRLELPRLEDVRAVLTVPSQGMVLLFNDLQGAAFRVQPALRTLAERAAEVTGQNLCLTGSGAALFRLFDEERPAAAFAAIVSERCSVRTVVARVGAE